MKTLIEIDDDILVDITIPNRCASLYYQNDGARPRRQQTYQVLRRH